MEAHLVKDNALSNLSRCQVLQQIAHLEAEYQEDWDSSCEDAIYHCDRFTPDSVSGNGTKLVHDNEKEDRKN